MSLAAAYVQAAGWPRREPASWQGWRVILDEARATDEQMAHDERLAGEAIPTVRLFLWNPPAISLGFKQAPPTWLMPARWRRAGLGLVERPTGGGMALHGSDVSVAVIVPRQCSLSLPVLMHAVCESAIRLCGSYGLKATGVLDARHEGRITYCLTEPSPYAVHVDGRKVAGFALRRFARNWLVQGSLLVSRVPKRLAEAMPQAVMEQLNARASCLADAAGEPISPRETAERWAANWPEWWDEAVLMDLAVEASRDAM